ncbi:hypothetical protein Tco_0717477 [Tanacetum coccineum]
MDESQSYLTAPEHRECYDGLIKSYDLDKSLYSTYDKVYSLKRIQKDKDKDKDPSARSDQGLKKKKTSKDVKPTKGPKTKVSKSGSSKGTKSQSKSSGKSVYAEEQKFEVVNSDMPQDQEENLGNVDEEPKRKDNPEGGDYPFDLTKPLPLVMNRNHQMKKATQYHLQGIEDMVPNIWTPVKVAYDKYALWGISHWRQQCKTFYEYARGLKSRHDVYSTKHILAVNRVEDMQKHRYGYMREIEVRRADNELYTFKEGDFPRLRINDIEDMLILVVHNRLTKLSGDDVSNFVIAL